MSDPAEPAAAGALPSATRASSSGRLDSARRRLARCPRPLALLLVVVACFGVAWALIVPAWQAPDEIAHFGYSQSLATRFALPGDAKRPAESTDQSLAEGVLGAGNLAFDPNAVRPNWRASDFRAYLDQVRQSHPSASDGGGPNAQDANPPLFYLWSVAGYWLAGSGATAFGRLYAMQLWNVLLLLTGVVGAWLLAGELIGRDRLAQLIAGAVAGLIPMVTFISTSINTDALMAPLWTLALWLGVRVIRRRAPTLDAAALGAITAAAVLTKATSYALVPAALLALALGWWRQPAAQRRERRAALLGGLALLVLPIVGWVVTTRALGRLAVNSVSTAPGHVAKPFRILDFLNYLWQYYLPRLPFMARVNPSGPLPVYTFWVRTGWATFGWLDVPVVGWVYPVVGAVSAAVCAAGIAILALLVRTRDQLAVAAFLLVALVVLLIGLHVTDYRAIITGNGTLLQGRYLLPVVGLFGVVLARGLGWLAPRWRAPAAGTVLAGLMLLQLLSLSTVAKVFYT